MNPSANQSQTPLAVCKRSEEHRIQLTFCLRASSKKDMLDTPNPHKANNNSAEVFHKTYKYLKIQLLKEDGKSSHH